MYDVTPACADVKVMDRKTADIAVVPKRKKVAIVGFATNTLHLVPWADPEFEIWGMNQGYMHMLRRGDRHFEMHHPEFTADVRDPGYLDWLNTCPVPVYMIDVREEVANSVRYPIEEAIHFAGGRDYFTSSVAFMLAVAGMEGFTEIHLYGINLAIGDEWFYEKACAEYWIGRLEGQGVKIVVPHASSLLKQYRRYGYFVDARPAAMTKILLQGRINEYTARAEKFLADFNTVMGAKRESEALLQIAEGTDHGADIVLMPAPPAPTT